LTAQEYPNREANPVLHTVLVGIHAALGGLAFIAGIVAIRRERLFTVFMSALVGTIVFLAAALAVEWSRFSPAERVIFAALMALGVYMLVRGVQASRLLPSRTSGPTAQYISHLGFNLIALFDAFVVVLILDLGGPIWLMVTVAAVVAIAGHFLLRAVKHKLASRPTTEIHRS
jgi:hypothetical protein